MNGSNDSQMTSETSPTASINAPQPSLPSNRPTLHAIISILLPNLIKTVDENDGIITPTETKNLADWADRLLDHIIDLQDEIANNKQRVSDITHTHQPYLQ